MYAANTRTAQVVRDDMVAWNGGMVHGCMMHGAWLHGCMVHGGKRIEGEEGGGWEMGAS